MALALGGWVHPGAGGAAVVVESRVHLPLALTRLAALPYPIDPSRPLVLLDTETTGLGTGVGTLPFLVGTGIWDGERLVVRQWYLPDQPQEPGFLAAIAATLPQDPWLVTYNGRSFDWPLLVARYRLQRRSAPAIEGHLDLLPVARQLWRHRLADARLASVETGVAGVRRHGDLPGALIPERYFRYLRTGEAAPLRDVGRHNLQDIVSLAMLLVVLAERLLPEDRRAACHPGDLAGLGAAYARRRRHEEALRCYETALRTGLEPGLRRRTEVQRARALGRVGRHDEAAAAWQAMAESGGPGASAGWIQVAKHLEHVKVDLPAALAAAEQARVRSERARLLGRPMYEVERDLAGRLPRLRRRLARCDAVAIADAAIR